MKKRLDYYCVKDFGLEILYVRNSNFHAEEHNHVSAYIINLVVAGVIEIGQGSAVHSLCANKVFWFRPYELHAIAAKTNYDLVTLVLPITFLEANHLNTAIEKMLQLIKKLSGIVCLMPDNLLMILDTIKMVYDDQRGKNMDITVDLAVKWYIHHPEENISLDKLAALTGFDKYYYLRLFKQKIGLTPHKFQVQNRIRKSQKLLEKNMPITEVALVMGFYDQSHFIRQFRRIVGISPTQYKRAFHFQGMPT